MSDSEIVIEVFGKMEIKPSEAMVKSIIITYNSCGIENDSIAMEETAISIGQVILEKHKRNRNN